MSERYARKVLILGATGPTGLLTLRKALEHNHHVTVYARNPSKIPSDISDSGKVKIIRGELTDAAELTKAIEGQDVVVSLLGPTGSVSGTPFTDAYRLIFSLMKQCNVKRILAMGTPSISDPEDGFSVLALLGVAFIRIIANSAYKDIVSLGELFETEATKMGLDWTIFRIGFLTDGAPQSSKAGYVAKNGWVMKNRRVDIAVWLVEEMEKDNSEWVRKRPAIWS